jgi:hypothetical protein
MNFKYITTVLALCGATVLSISCDKNEAGEFAPTDKGAIVLEFDNVVGSQNLQLNGPQTYVNANGDQFNVTLLNYYISNIKLNGVGNSYSETESYHLLEASNAENMEFDLNNVPAGNYTSITYTIGVDSLRNISGAQTGALDPANGMFWSWSTGYIMLKLEGVSPQSTQSDKTFVLHAGGFSGANSVVRTITLNLPNTLVVKSEGSTHMHIAADVLKTLKAPNIIDFSTTNVIHMPGASAKRLADNYANMFTVTEVGH